LQGFIPDCVFNKNRLNTKKGLKLNILCFDLRYDKIAVSKRDIILRNKNQLKEAEEIAKTYQLNPTWYDFWHIHLDWWGQGNRNIEEHRKYIILYLQLMNRFVEQAKAFDKPWQTWLLVDLDDSSQDALYFHTPNPNQDNFPFGFDGVNWGIQMPALLKNIVYSENYFVGEAYYQDIHSYYIKLK